MLKRSTKVISLLTTAAAIMTMVPAMAADVQKVSAEDGTVYAAKSNADGTFYMDAELNGGDEAIYAYKDGKYNKIDGADAGNTIGDVFSYEDNNYLQMADGDYYVNLKTGETTNEDIEGNINDDADENLRKAIKNDNDDRFACSTTNAIISATKGVRNDGTDEVTIYGVTGKWREYFYDLKNPVSINNGAYSKTTSTVFSDDGGKYIDADYNLGNVTIYTTEDSISIKNTEDTYDLDVIEDGNKKTYEYMAKINNDKVWDEGSEYITRTANLSIFRRIKNSGGEYENVTDQVYFGSSGNHHKQTAINGSGDDMSVTVMQRISKAQSSDDIDGIKYAKDVKTYFITDEDGKEQPLLGLGQTNNADNASVGYGIITGQTDGHIVSLYRDLANLKEYAETINFKSEDGYYYTDVDDADSVEADSTDSFGIGCGDVYALSHDGYIERFNGKDSKFEKIYKVDAGETNLSISLPFYAIAWNKDDEVYSIISKNPAASLDKEKDTTTASQEKTVTADTATASAKSGWVKAADGTWNYINSDGTKATGWYKEGSTWYYLKSDGIMATGWQKVNDIWYYLNGSGSMKTGWINDNGTWYYCDASGAMLVNTTIDGYALGANGAWIK